MTTSSPSTPASASLSSGPTREGNAADDGLSIAFSDVGYRHRWGNWALHNITHTFRPGTITGLLGRNGSGKSTLLDLAAGGGGDFLGFLWAINTRPKHHQTRERLSHE